ncbi:NADPH-dependent F420 reductase [Marinibactrum halimedae]|uniref:Pyrroline-5-carboxylate reductase catalytic N-terminal domain-containing protein n=2 Tax=Marinibactrum halimedae TaxID=1444977 RepID=A0AA37WQM5_9GAMM|nr:NAD(P)-binding domain-containing protein [Marinibactrum halimedae]MCD9459445.1 NAD(P)-binding domain-containing protein [Marinibactrum halimedae]GLS27487.1 hypothetical protein GCM10007877_32060 [Marinibactrum halimedae]
MKIGIIGAGAIGQLYASLWSTAGHQVMLSSRHPESIQLNSSQSNSIAFGTVQEAASFGEVILLAVNYNTVDAALDAIRTATVGKLVIDATNPLVWNKSGGTDRVIHDDEIAGLVMAKRLPKARIAKAFTSLWTGYVEQHSNVDKPTIAMPLAADEAHDCDTVAELIKDAGLVPVVLGTLAESRPLDPPSPIWNVVLTKNELIERTQQFRAELAA